MTNINLMRQMPFKVSEMLIFSLLDFFHVQRGREIVFLAEIITLYNFFFYER